MDNDAFSISGADAPPSASGAVSIWMRGGLLPSSCSPASRLVVPPDARLVREDQTSQLNHLWALAYPLAVAGQTQRLQVIVVYATSVGLSLGCLVQSFYLQNFV